MFSLMLQKILHKKWMVICLLIGNILLMAVAVSHPMYRVSSFQKMLTDEFEQYKEDNQCWPATFSVKYGSIKGGAGIGYNTMEEEAIKAVDKLRVGTKADVAVYQLSSQKGLAKVARDGEKDKRITLGAISKMNEHVELLYGDFPADTLADDGAIEVMVSDELMVTKDILLQDEFTFDSLSLPDGRKCVIRVVGVFRPVEEDSLYWELASDYVHTQVMASEILYRNTFFGEGVENQYSMSAIWRYALDYENIDITDVTYLLRTLDGFERSENLKGRISEDAYKQILSDYSSKATRIEATLTILQIPVLLLLCAFLYMISGQMLQMEQNEISLMRSRGASKRQILSLYVMQSSFLGILSMIIGIPLGALFCKMLGSATAFLQFSAVRSLEVRYAADIWLYGIAAFLVSVIMTTIPVLSYSGISIVNLKQSRSRQKKSLWKRMYLDIILLAISLYGYYSFKRSVGQMTEDVLTGRSLDPLLYISFSVFILGAGLFVARIQPWILKGWFALFKNHMKPSTYTSVIGAIRTGKKQEFIILFMILTVSIGISNTMIARTIVLNAVNNTRHVVGADITLKEKWSDNAAAVMHDPSLKLTYLEPDFSRYEVIPGVETATKVICDSNGKVEDGSVKLDVTIMGIKSKGFFDVTVMEDGLLPYSYIEYLNMLSVEPQAVLVSENFMIKHGYRLGDRIVFKNSDDKTATGYIYGFFNYWPGYEPVSYSLGEDGSVQTTDRYLIVSNLSYLNDKWGVYPYQVWMDVSDGGEGLYEWIENQPTLKLTALEDMEKEEEAIVRDTMFQGTNGILSMSFIVILLLCCVGYLIYWIMSIRSRELLFGVLRAMGMRKKEITWMLVVEQICSGLFAIVAGGGIGILASNMFVPMIQQAYAASEQVLPLKLITRTGDLVQLFAVIGIMLCVCLAVLGRIVSKMNISSALKLGED